MYKRVFIFLAVILALAGNYGCSNPAENEVALGQEFTLSAGRSAVVTGEDLTLKFIEVISDSRCPTGATCIWAGEVSCLLEITRSGSTFQKTLTQPGPSEPPVATFAGYRITYDVRPYPELGKEIKDDEYRLHLTVDKAGALSGGILATFDVNGEEYSIFITNKVTIEQVFALQRGESQATIPSGRLVRGPVFYNEPWSWHIDAEDIHMAEITIELCDGTPSQVENNLDYWLETVERFCPWGAGLVSIEDFR